MVEPEFDFFVTGLLSRWHLEDVNVGFFTTVEITDDDVGKFGEGAWANVTTDVVFIFVHEEESVSAVEILVERGVNVSKVFGIVAFGRDGARKVDNIVATTFKIPSPISGAFLELGAASNN